nr:retrovirus-related Pol polyprotein from transposon TNT 1-94 [Tanacetum cinerariifolium]
MSRQLVEMNNNVLRLQEKTLEKESKILELEGYVRNKDLEIEKCLERMNECENKHHKIGKKNQTIHMIMTSKDNLYNGRKGIGFENPSYFEKEKDLRPSLYDEKVIGLGYTLMFLTHSDEAFEIEKFKRARENKIEFAYDYGNLNTCFQTSSLKPYVPTVILEKIIIDLEYEFVSLLEKEKANMETIESLKSKGFESSENAISEPENQSENGCQVVEKELPKTSYASKNVENKTKRKRRKRKSSKQNDKQVTNGVLHANRDFVHFSDLDTFSGVRRPKHSGVIWKKKGSSNTSNVDLSFVSHSKLNKDVKRCSRKDLLSCNNSHLGETSSTYVCNDAMNVSCNSRLYDSFDENNLFIFDDESVRNSQVSKMPFRKKSNASLNVPSRRCSKHMTGNRALLMNFEDKFLRTVRFGNNDFAVIARMAQQNYVVERRNRTLVKAARTMITFENLPLFLWAEAIATACFTQNRLIIHNRLDKTPYELINKRKPNIKFFRVFGCRCYLLNDYDDVGKLKAKWDIGVFLDIQKKVTVPSSNSQSVLNNMVPNVDEASTSYNVFNEHLKDAYFDASTLFHDSSNVHTFYQPYPHEKKCIKDHPLHKIISNLKLSVRTRGQLANSCLFSCLLSSIEPANVAEDLRDADWVSAMQEKIDQSARLKVWRLVPRPESKTIIKTM